MKRSEIIFGLARIPVDMSMGIGAFLLAYLIRAKTDLIPGVHLPIGEIPPVKEYIVFLAIASTGLVLLGMINGLYSLSNTIKIREELWKMLYVSFLWVMGMIGYFFLVREFFFSRLVLVYGAICAAIALMMGRLLVRSLERFCLKRGIGRHRVLFIGYNDLSKTLAKSFEKEKRYKVIGAIDDHVPAHTNQTMEYLGPLQYLDTLVEKEQIDELIATDPKIKKDTLEALLEYSYMYHLRFRFVPDAFEVQRTNVAITEESGIPVIEMKPSPLDGWGRVVKRMVDIVGALFGMILLSPLLVLTALSIKIDSRGPVIFAQKRYGKNGKLFTFYKFRSMRVGAEKEHEKLMEQSERGGLLKMKQDPRVTRLGRILRKTSIDELPQLWNVLRGDMSLVGPRPHMPAEVDKMTKKYHMVLHMKPGITGLAATSGRSSIDFDAEMRLDLYYMENWSLLLDIAIILKTIKVCLLGKDAS